MHRGLIGLEKTQVDANEPRESLSSLHACIGTKRTRSRWPSITVGVTEAHWNLGFYANPKFGNLVVALVVPECTYLN